MKRPSRKTLYALMALFVVLAVVSVIVGTPIAILLWLVMLAIVVYFVLVALDDAGKLRRR